MTISLKWILPLSRAQRALGQLSTEYRNETRHGKQRQKKRGARGFFSLGIWKAAVEPRGERPGAWAAGPRPQGKPETFPGLCVVQTRPSRQHRNQTFRTTRGH